MFVENLGPRAACEYAISARTYETKSTILVNTQAWFRLETYKEAQTYWAYSTFYMLMWLLNKEC